MRGSTLPMARRGAHWLWYSAAERLRCGCSEVQELGGRGFHRDALVEDGVAWSGEGSSCGGEETGPWAVV